MNVTHLGTYGILIKDKQILLIKKSRGPYKGKLDLPGGRLEHGEGVVDGLAREIREETGITLRHATPFENVTTVVEYDDERGNVSMHHIGLLYLVTDFDDTEQISEMNVEDSLGSNWHALNLLNHDKLSPFAAKAVRHLQGI